MKKLLRFTIIGALGFLVDVGILNLLYPQFGFYLGRFFSFLAAVLFTWIGNSIWTFEKKQHNGISLIEGIFYLFLMSIGGIINFGIYSYLIGQTNPMKIYPSLAVAAGSLSGLIFNWIGSNYFLYKQISKDIDQVK